MRALVAAVLFAAALLARADGGPSARETAAQIVALLAAGDVESVARLSNAPQRRREVLEDYRAQVGEEEFRRIFARYRDAAPIVEEIAFGQHRLVIRELQEPQRRLVGQYFVHVDGRFVIDDAPSEARERLRRALRDYRNGRVTR